MYSLGIMSVTASEFVVYWTRLISDWAAAYFAYYLESYKHKHYGLPGYATEIIELFA